MITIVTDITDSDLLKTYWCPLICKHREVQFLFGSTKDVKRPNMKDWSNVRFATKPAKDLVKHANTKYVYMTVQNEIPTYKLMVDLINPVEGLVPKIHGTDEDSSSFVVKKNNYPKFETKVTSDVTTYLL